MIYLFLFCLLCVLAGRIEAVLIMGSSVVVLLRLNYEEFSHSHGKCCQTALEKVFVLIE